MAPHADKYTDDCDLYLWKLFQCVVIRNLSQEQNKRREREQETKEEREGGKEIQYTVQQKLTSSH